MKTNSFDGIQQTQQWRNARGKLHRTDGPAIIYADGDQEWWVNGKPHRTDGPAVIYANGTKLWYINGNNITEELNQWMKNRGCYWSENNPWNEDIKIEFLLVFSK